VGASRGGGGAARALTAPRRDGATHAFVAASPFARAQAQDAFGDCLYSPRDVAGFALGLASIGARPSSQRRCMSAHALPRFAHPRARAGCWLVAQLPQVLANARNGSADALSPWFLVRYDPGSRCW